MENNFKSDLARAKPIENEVCGLIKAKYPSAYVVEDSYVEKGYTEKGFDIIVPEIPVTVEVKYDEASNKYPNFFIETESNGIPSGLSTTKSNWWVQVNDEVVVWVYTESLKYLIEREWKLKEFEFRKMNPPKRGYLIPQNKLLSSSYVKWGERKLCPIIPF